MADMARKGKEGKMNRNDIIVSLKDQMTRKKRAFAYRLKTDKEFASIYNARKKARKINAKIESK